MIVPSALNFLIVTVMGILGGLLVKFLSAQLLMRNPDSGAGKALAAMY